MIRDLASLADRQFDVVVLGGGIFGACAAWEAALRGLSVALIEKRDFSHATSANHFKMVHCGIRYLQHADIRRLRESSHERSALLRIAPHLVHTLPIVIPTYGHGVKGKAFLGTGMLLYDALTVDRNRGLLPEKKIHPSRFLSASEVVQRFPGIQRRGLTGAAVFEEGQMYNPPRLAVAFLRSAVARGAMVANYVEAIGFLKKGNRITGVQARNVLDGNFLQIRSHVVLNTAGPWAHRLLATGLGLQLKPQPTFSRDLAFVIPRCFQTACGLALATDTKDADTLIDRGGRHLFVIPWRDYTLIGVWHRIFDAPPEALTVTENELAGYRNEINRAYPGLIPSLGDIHVVNMGLTLFGEEDRQASGKISFGHRSQVIDHLAAHGLEGLLTLIGVRATTARGMAVKAFNLIGRRLNHKGSISNSAVEPIFGGDIDNFKGLQKEARETCRGKLDENQIVHLVRNYGSQYKSVLQHANGHPELLIAIEGSNVLKCEILHAVRDEMAQKLSDVILRRTDLGSGKMPAQHAIETCATLMAGELGWDTQKKQAEIEELGQNYRPWVQKENTASEIIME